MSTVDPLAALFADFDRPTAPRAEFVEELRGRLLGELQAPRSRGVAPTRLLRQHSRLRFALIAVALFIVLAGIATATYLLLDAGKPHDLRGGALTFFEMPPQTSGSSQAATIVAVRADGGRQTVWRCPHDRFCGEPEGLDWSPDGRRLALTLVEYGANSLYPGLHIVDISSGTDRQPFGTVSLGAPGAQRRAAVARLRVLDKRFGCIDPESVAWSPDGRRLAYSCGLYEFEGRADPESQVWLVNADASDPEQLRTGTTSAAWPSWSPDGRRITFSTSDGPTGSSNVYVIDLDGSHRRLLAHGGVAPVWSPRGGTIAYRSTCGGVRLVTPAGRDVTPGRTKGSCPGVGLHGWPVWAPDGLTLAIATFRGLFEVHTDGSDLHQVTKDTLISPADTVIRPAWLPTLALPLRNGKSRHKTPGTNL